MWHAFMASALKRAPTMAIPPGPPAPVAPPPVEVATGAAPAQTAGEPPTN
jgi:hypothetical protein